MIRRTREGLKRLVVDAPDSHCCGQLAAQWLVIVLGHSVVPAYEARRPEFHRDIDCPWERDPFLLIHCVRTEEPRWRRVRDGTNGAALAHMLDSRCFLIATRVLGLADWDGALVHACQRRELIDVVPRLLLCGAFPLAFALGGAVMHGNHRAMELLLQEGAYADGRPWPGCDSHLHQAVRRGDVVSAAMLRRFGARVDEHILADIPAVSGRRGLFVDMCRALAVNPDSLTSIVSPDGIMRLQSPVKRPREE